MEPTSSEIAMDDPIKRALEQARGLALTDEITRATQSYRDILEGPAGSAVRQVMEQLNREEEMRKAILGVDSFTERFLKDFADNLDQHGARLQNPGKFEALLEGPPAGR
jgi:hypothetical protein